MPFCLKCGSSLFCKCPTPDARTKLEAVMWDLTERDFIQTLVHSYICGELKKHNYGYETNAQRVSGGGGSASLYVGHFYRNLPSGASDRIILATVNNPSHSALLWSRTTYNADAVMVNSITDVMPAPLVTRRNIDTMIGLMTQMP
jgi:hypothetical protein